MKFKWYLVTKSQFYDRAWFDLEQFITMTPSMFQSNSEYRYTSKEIEEK